MSSPSVSDIAVGDTVEVVSGADSGSLSNLSFGVVDAVDCHGGASVVSTPNSQGDGVSVCVSSVTFSGSTSSNIDLRTGSSLKFVPHSDPPVSKKARTSPVWQYFQHFDLSYHPEKRCFCICLICHVNGIDKAVSVGQSASPGPLISHLRTHKAEYLEYVEKKNSLDAAASAATVSNQLSISPFVQILQIPRSFLERNLLSG
jgi:hypothetical protein